MTKTARQQLYGVDVFGFESTELYNPLEKRLPLSLLYLNECNAYVIQQHCKLLSQKQLD